MKLKEKLAYNYTLGTDTNSYYTEEGYIAGFNSAKNLITTVLFAESLGSPEYTKLIIEKLLEKLKEVGEEKVKENV